jgi:thiamine biosynthesis lipoprotein
MATVMAVLLALGAPALITPAQAVVVSRSAFVMGTTLTVRVEAPDRSHAIQAAEQALSAVEQLEDLLSTWRPGSELSRLNALPPGVHWAGDPRVLSLVREALAWRDSTGGAFDPGIGALVDAWDLRGEGKVPEEKALADALRRAGPAAFPSTGSLRRTRDGAWLDAGAFGKGAALREAEWALREADVTLATLDFGGQILHVGGGTEVVLAHPDSRDGIALRLSLRPGARGEALSIATSGLSERFVSVGGARYGHVIDPRAGRPIEPWGTVTVVAVDPLVADILSTALLVMGPEEGVAFMDRHAYAGAVFLISTPGGVSPVFSRGLDRFLVSTPPPPPETGKAPT